MNNEKDTKRKNMYVPDEDVLAEAKAIKEAEEAVEVDTVEEVAEAAEPVEEKSKKSKKSKKDTDEKDGKKANILVRIARAVIPMRSDEKRTVLIKCVAIVAAVALIVSGTYLATYFINLGQQDAKIDNVRNNYELNRDDYSKNEDNQFSKFDVLKSQNSDIVGWITISDTEVNNPVYQTIDNQYYVDHDMDKKYNSYGALFLDYRCDINPMSLTQNQIIYGHNMRYGAMFGTLDEYRSLDYYKQNPIISFDSLYEQRVYKIFAIMVVNDSEDETFGYSYTAYRTTFTSDDDFTSWIKHSRERSLYDTPVDVNAQDEIITLSTCCYDYDNARFVILGRLVREGESPTVDTSTAVKNADVIYSKEYYAKKGMKIPQIASSETTTSENKK